MRLVKVQAPEGQGDAVAQLAFAAGIAKATVRQEQVCRPNQRTETKDVVDVEIATPTAKQFIEAVMAAPFFDPRAYSITVRQPRAVAADLSLRQLTMPLVEPSIELLEELWQFSYITSVLRDVC
jgi:hypothetical protein